MNWGSIIGTVIVLVLLYYFLRWLFSSSSSFSTPQNATEQHEVDGGKLEKVPGSANVTYCIWIYVDNWNVNNGQEKPVLAHSNFKLTLGETLNDLTIYCPVKGGGINTCGIPNIPLQKWVCILVSLYGRSLDAYIDGKLVKTCILDNTANISFNDSVTIGGGFSGKVGGFRFIPGPTNPEQAWNIYREGISDSSMFARYGVKVQILKENKAVKEFVI